MKRIKQIAILSSLMLGSSAMAADAALSPRDMQSLEKALIADKVLSAKQFKMVEQAISDLVIDDLSDRLSLERIIAGELSPQGEFPWMVALIARKSNGKLVQFCGGTLIAPNKVLTAAHCYVVSEKAMFVSINRVDLTPPLTELIPVATFAPHPDFVRVADGNDVAIITLARDSTAGPLSLATEEPVIPEDTQVVAEIAGWGATSEGGPSSLLLLKAEVPYALREQCLTAYPDLPTKTLCAGFKTGGVDTCQGDSGGPLFGMGKVFGITSFGHGCARQGFYGVYTSVAAFHPWISAQ